MGQVFSKYFRFRCYSFPRMLNTHYSDLLERIECCGLDWSGSGRYSSCELGNEPSVSIKCWETTEWLHNLWPLEWYSAPQLAIGRRIERTQPHPTPNKRQWGRSREVNTNLWTETRRDLTDAAYSNLSLSKWLSLLEVGTGRHMQYHVTRDESRLTQ
jgi:hypothetical protein